MLLIKNWKNVIYRKLIRFNPCLVWKTLWKGRKNPFFYCGTPKFDTTFYFIPHFYFLLFEQCFFFTFPRNWVAYMTLTTRLPWSWCSRCHKLGKNLPLSILIWKIEWNLFLLCQFPIFESVNDTQSLDFFTSGCFFVWINPWRRYMLHCEYEAWILFSSFLGSRNSYSKIF
jgi:hypothetical protein